MTVSTGLGPVLTQRFVQLFELFKFLEISVKLSQCIEFLDFRRQRRSKYLESTHARRFGMLKMDFREIANFIFPYFWNFSTNKDGLVRTGLIRTTVVESQATK